MELGFSCRSIGQNPEKIKAYQTLVIARRNGLAEDAVRAIMAAQLPRAERLAHADDVIRNDGDMAHLQTQVLNLHRQYLQLGSAAPGDR